MFVALALATWPQAEAARQPVPLEGFLVQQSALTEPLVIVVNKSNPVAELSLAELRRWPGADTLLSTLSRRCSQGILTADKVPGEILPLSNEDH